MSDRNERTIEIRLTPGARNQIKLWVVDDNRFVIDLHEHDTVVWTVQPESEHKIKRWVVSFLEEGTPGHDDGSPLSMERGGEPVYQIRGKRKAVTTYVIGGEDREYRFSVAAEGDDGTLYSIDPEIRVRPDVGP